MLHNIRAILNVNIDWLVLKVDIANAFDIISQRLYFKSCMFQQGNYFNLYLSSILFMPHSSFFSLVTTPYKVSFLVFSPLLAPIRRILWVVTFSPQFIFMTFVAWLVFPILFFFSLQMAPTSLGLFQLYFMFFTIPSN